MTQSFSPLRIWMVLIALTLLSYGWSVDQGWPSPRLSGSAVIAMALAKAWLIGMRFMELNEAIWALRWMFNLWIVVTGTMLLVMFWIAP